MRKLPVAKLLLILEAAVLLCFRLTAAIEDPCSACGAVAKELQHRLDTEKARSTIDMRGRLDSQGNRFGKVIDYRVSDQRMDELLEGLCKIAFQYRLVDGTWLDTRGNAKGLPEAPRQQVQAERQNLENHCARLLESHEEALLPELQRSSVPVQELLCSTLSKACTARTPTDEL